jgi:hypothetical protein
MLNFTPLDPIRALFWSGRVRLAALAQGWLAAAAMSVAAVGMFATWGS